MAAALFQAAIAISYLRVLFASDGSIGTLYKERLEITPGFGNPNGFLLPGTFVVGRNQSGP